MHVLEGHSDLVTAVVLELAPPGLSKELSVVLAPDEKPTVNVKFVQKPTAQDQAVVERLVTHTLMQVHREIRRRGWE